ncbi:MAG: flavin reductase family protein [Motiliproteus sp.]
MNQPVSMPAPQSDDRRYRLRMSATFVDDHSENEASRTAVSAAPGAESKQAFVGAMSRRVSSVNLVATDGEAGRFGLTVTSMCSVSAEPPLVMIGINRNSPMCQAISVNGCFAINVLAVQQKHLADSFSGIGLEQHCYDFSQACWYAGVTGSPVLADGAASFECELASFQDVGSHRMFLGRVIKASKGSSATLCYSERGYKYARTIKVS